MSDNDEMLLRATAALLALARHNIPPDTQELLVRGNPSRDVPPGALSAAIAAALAPPNPIMENKDHEY